MEFIVTELKDISRVEFCSGRSVEQENGNGRYPLFTGGCQKKTIENKRLYMSSRQKFLDKYLVGR